MTKVAFKNLSRSNGSALADKSVYFGMEVYPELNLAIGAHGNPGSSSYTGGFVIYDITNKSAPEILLEIPPPDETGSGRNNQAECRTAKLYGTPGVDGVILCCWRQGHFNTAYNCESLLFRIEVSDPDPDNWGIDLVNWADKSFFLDDTVVAYEGIENEAETPVPSVPLFSDLDIDHTGGRVGVACQRNGLMIFDIDDIGSGPVKWNNVQTPRGWETQSVKYDDSQWLVCSTAKGYRVLDSAGDDLAADAGFLVNLSSEGAQVKAWDSVASANGDYIFVSYNTTGTVDATNNCGFYVIDRTTRTAPVNGTVYPIPGVDRSIWSGNRDAPCYRITRLDNCIYVSNLHKGVAIWDVSDPLNPVYLGTHYNTLYTAPGSAWIDSISAIAVWREGKEVFACYGDGYQVAGNGSKSFYIDQFLFNGSTELPFAGTVVIDPTGFSVAGGQVYSWPINSALVRSSNALVADDGLGGSDGLVAHLETTESILVSNIYIAYQRVGGTVAQVFDFWLVECELSGAVWIPVASANGAALTEKASYALPPGTAAMQIVRIPLPSGPALIPAGKKILVVGQLPSGTTGGTINFANLDGIGGVGASSRTAPDADTDTWSSSAPALGMWFDYAPVPVSEGNDEIFRSVTREIFRSI